MRILCFLVLGICSAFPAYSDCISGNCNNGFGTIVVHSKGKYTGEFKNGIPEGKGIFYYSNQDKYLGRWKAGKRHGKGKLITADFSYFGEFRNGHFNGQGKISYTNGDTYSGLFKHGKLVRRMAEQVPNETRIAVTQNNVNYSKPTSYKFAKNCNDAYCDGEYGTYTYKDGSVYKGYFKFGNPDGEGSVSYANGHVYQGQWKFHTPHGTGIYTFTDGRKISGNWHKGRIVKKSNKIERENSSLVHSSKSKVKKSKDSKIWAVIVGVAAYNHMPSLKYTDDDAYKMYAFLKSPEGGALPDEQIKVLVDDQATKSGIMAAMENLYLQADENDLVMLYFSGHGLQGSFIPYDFDGYNNKLMHDEIESIFEATEAKHKVCYIDACYSGGYASAKGLSVEQSMRQFYEQLDNSKSSTAFLLSSKENEVSLEYKGLRQGIFTHYLMRGMKGEADQDANKIVTINELFKFVNNGVKTYTAYNQNPVINGKFDRMMPVAMIR